MSITSGRIMCCGMKARWRIGCPSRLASDELIFSILHTAKRPPRKTGRPLHVQPDGGLRYYMQLLFLFALNLIADHAEAQQHHGIFLGFGDSGDG